MNPETNPDTISDTLSFDAARERWLDNITRLAPEYVPLSEALGRVLAADARSDIDVSPFDNSAMDGFALRAADIADASADAPVELAVATTIAAGDCMEGTLVPGECARIMTGAPVPAGADTVVKIEDTATPEATQRARFIKPSPPAMNIRLRGEEVKAGECVLIRGDLLGPAAIGLLAATGHATVPVYQQPTVGVISTGEELIDVEQVPTAGKIRNSNSYSLAAQVRAAGAKVRQYANIHDTLEDTIAAFRQATAECDLVISSGGVSVGDFDYVVEAVRSMGDLQFASVKMRPGKPQTTGLIGRTPFFGLPGNPASAYIGFELFVRPAIRKMAGHTALRRPVQKAVLDHDLNKRAGFRYFMRGRLRLANDPTEYVRALREGTDYRVAVTENQSSALLTSLHHANCLLVLPEDETLVSAGTVIDCMRLDIDENVVV
ncbi:MAG: molybdopterin molybdotransferase MoeA [Coriobacteriia bacterium]|nr:molybdopterin molybdotransferase MoeA [Coriobacteriia bacterium]MCL2537567.1 molybdopterin molybdotransferase MoeA [Coriobacteriia bacterium]